MDKIIVTISGIASLIGVYIFFFGKKETASPKDDSLTIIVNGGYAPSNIAIKKHKKVTLTFVRKDKNPCLEDLIIPDLKIKKYLPIDTPVSVTLTPQQTGRHDFHCGMNMYHGTISIT